MRLPVRSAGREADDPQPALDHLTLPGLADLLARLPDDRSSRLLDLGALVVTNFDLFARHAGQVRFADVWRDALPGSGSGTDDRVDPTRALPVVDGTPGYDAVFAWDVLDCLEPGDVEPVVRRIADICRPRARLHALFTASGARPTRPSRYAITPDGRARRLDDRPRTAPTSGLAPADLERHLAPFAVEHSVLLRHGAREVVAVLR